MTTQHPNFIQSFFHGTKADLKSGDLLVAQYQSNYAAGMQSKFVYFTSNLNVAIWGAELANGEGLGRIYIVEPVGAYENDPNLTDKKFAGNPTRSFRTREALKVVGEVIHWARHSADEIREAKEKIEAGLKNGAEIIND